VIISGHESRRSGKYPISYCGEIEIREAHWLLNKKITFPISARRGSNGREKQHGLQVEFASLHVGREALRDRHYFRIKNSALRITSPNQLTRKGSLWVAVSYLGVNVNVNINTHNPHVTRLRAACIDDDVDEADRIPLPRSPGKYRPALPAFYLSWYSALSFKADSY